MTLDEFWSPIGEVDGDSLRSGDDEGAVGPLVEALSTHGEEEIRAFEDVLSRCLYDIDGRRYADAAGESGRSSDGFLYARCYVVARGRAHYEAVKADPAKMPKSLDDWCEPLLYVAQMAWAEATGEDGESWGSQASVSYETGSNQDAWT
jgi:hypothetical protein